MLGVIFVNGIWVLWVFFLLCLVGCFSMIIWTPTVLSVLYACVLYFCICTCLAHLSMIHMERRSRNTLIIIITIIIIISISKRCVMYRKGNGRKACNPYTVAKFFMLASQITGKPAV